MAIQNKSKMYIAVISIGLGLLLTACHSPAPKETVFIPKSSTPQMKNSEEKIGMQRATLDLNKIKKYDKIKISVIVAKQQIPQNFWNRTNVIHLFYTHQEVLQRIAS